MRSMSIAGENCPGARRDPDREYVVPRIPAALAIGQHAGRGSGRGQGMTEQQEILVATLVVVAIAGIALYWSFSL